MKEISGIYKIQSKINPSRVYIDSWIIRRAKIKVASVLLFSLLSINSFADIVINKDTTVNNTWTIPATTILRFETGGHISGTGTISGGIIQAALTQDIFDTTINLISPGLYGREFSVMWYGAKPANVDNYNNLNKAITTCIGNSIRNLYVPRGTYSYSKSLLIASIQGGLYTGCTLHFHGETSFWDSDGGSELYYTAVTNTMALGLQLNKGSEIDHLTITGKWVSPTTVDSVYYNTIYNNYTDKNGVYADGYTGIEIDPNPNQDNSYSGSTGVHIHDMIIKNFTTLISISKNEVTLNADILVFENIQFGDAKTGFISREGQEKGNVIRGIYSWGSLHTLFNAGNSPRMQGGGYTIDGGNIAGRCIRLLWINASGWNAVNISNIYCEQLGNIGTIATDEPLTVYNCTFDFAYPLQTGGTVNLLTSNSEYVLFQNCKFRYFGQGGIMPFSGVASYINCIWSGTYTNTDLGGRFQITLPSGVKLIL